MLPRLREINSTIIVSIAKGYRVQPVPNKAKKKKKENKKECYLGCIVKKGFFSGGFLFFRAL
jgi:hypothetical protein